MTTQTFPHFRKRNKLVEKTVESGLAFLENKSSSPSASARRSRDNAGRLQRSKCRASPLFLKIQTLVVLQFAHKQGLLISAPLPRTSDVSDAHDNSLGMFERVPADSELRKES